MKYALKYFSTSRILDKVDEIIIRYKQYTPALLDFVRERPNQRIIVVYECFSKEDNDKNADLFAMATEINSSFTVMLNDFEDDEYMVEALQKRNVKYFFSLAATSLDMLNLMIRQKPTDIYIAEELCFNIREVSEYCHKYNVSVRVYPNVAESRWYHYNLGIKDFFIRPDDLDAYEAYVDVIEFYGPLVKQDVLYEIYRDGRWQGLLNELILGFSDTEEINCMNLMPDFGYYRTNCKHRCMLEQCNYCDISKSLAQTLKEKDIYITREKKKYEYNANEEPIRNEGAESISISAEVSE